MSNYLKIGIAGFMGALIGAGITYFVMQRMMNWVDFVTYTSSAGLTQSILEKYENEGTEKGKEALIHLLEIKLGTAIAKCEYIKCRENPEEYSIEISTIDDAKKYLERIPITNRSTATQ